MSESSVKPQKRGGKRGSSYPSFDLEEAIAKIQRLKDREGIYDVPMSVAVSHWGYGPKSSGGRQAVSTLIQYGLIEDSGSGDSRMIKLSRPALEILLKDKGSDERKEVIEQTLTKPKLFADIVDKYPDGKASDSTLEYYLITEKKVNHSVVKSVIQDFRKSCDYVDSLFDGDDKKNTIEETKEVKEGDLIQWESGGVLQFPKPKKVRALYQDESDNNWVFVEGSETGIPMNEVIVESKGRATAPPPPFPPPKMPLSTFSEGRGESMGEKEWLRSALSKDVSMRITITGAEIPSARQIDKLIKLLEAQKLILDDDE